MKENPNITATTIALRLDVTKRTITRKIKELKEAGIIERTGPDKKGSWKVLK